MGPRWTRHLALGIVYVVATLNCCAAAHHVKWSRLDVQQQLQKPKLACALRGGATKVPYTPGATGGAGLGGLSSRQGQRSDEAESVDTPQYAEAFLMRDSRVGFIRKVYLSLACQLLFTAGAVVLTTQRKAELLPWLLAGERQGRLGAVMYGGMAIAISSLLALQVKAFKGFGPTLALLTLFTVGESMMVSIITLFFKARSVYMGLIQTAVATLGLSLYAFQTNPKYDLTGVGQALASGLLVLLMFGILRIAFPGTFGGTDLLYSSFGAGLFSLFIVYDTQRVIGGKHRQVDQVDRKDWALGSVALYTDVLQLFIHLLHIFGSREQ